MAFDLAFVDEVGAVDDVEGFADVVVSDEDGEAGFAEHADDVLDLGDGDGVDA